MRVQLFNSVGRPMSDQDIWEIMLVAQCGQGYWGEMDFTKYRLVVDGHEIPQSESIREFAKWMSRPPGRTRLRAWWWKLWNWPGRYSRQRHNT
jgi:hypothetical protein